MCDGKNSSLMLGTPVRDTAWIATVWCVGIVLVFVPLSVGVYRRVTARS